MIGHLLDPAIRQSHGVGAINIAQPVPGLLFMTSCQKFIDFLTECHLDIKGGSIAGITNIILELVRGSVLITLVPSWLKTCALWMDVTEASLMIK